MEKQHQAVTKKNRIDAKAASAIAKQYYQDIAESKDYRLTLEEIELSSDNKYWLITIGVYTPTTSPIFLTQGFNERLDYKIFQIDAETGEVVSMKIKLLQPLSNVQQK